MDGERRRKMSTRGKTAQVDSIRVNVPLLRVCPNGLNRFRCLQKRSRIRRMACAVMQDKALESVGLKPERDRIGLSV